MKYLIALLVLSSTWAQVDTATTDTTFQLRELDKKITESREIAKQVQNKISTIEGEDAQGYVAWSLVGASSAAYVSHAVYKPWKDVANRFVKVMNARGADAALRDLYDSVISAQDGHVKHVRKTFEDMVTKSVDDMDNGIKYAKRKYTRYLTVMGGISAVIVAASAYYFIDNSNEEADVTKIEAYQRDYNLEKPLALQYSNHSLLEKARADAEFAGRLEMEHLLLKILVSQFDIEPSVLQQKLTGYEKTGSAL